MRPGMSIGTHALIVEAAASAAAGPQACGGAGSAARTRCSPHTSGELAERHRRCEQALTDVAALGQVLGKVGEVVPRETTCRVVDVPHHGVVIEDHEVPDGIEFRVLVEVDNVDLLAPAGVCGVCRLDL